MKGFRSFAKGLGGAVLGSGDGTSSNYAAIRSFLAAQLKYYRELQETSTPQSKHCCSALRMVCLRKIGEKPWRICVTCWQTTQRCELPAADQQLDAVRASSTWLDSIQAKLVVGAQGLPVLIATVREGHSDIDMLRGSLECLAIVMSHSGSQAEVLGKVRPRAAALKGYGN